MVTKQVDTVQLDQVILNGGLPSINFFNGRLLSSEDLNMEKDANNEARRRLGQAIGDGVIDGLQVTLNTSSPDLKASVHVLAGSALNRNGQLFTLPKDTDVVLVPTPTQQAVSAGLFGVCEPPRSTPVDTGNGVYILTLSPVSGFDGKATVSGLAGVAGGTACGSRYKVEGVRFGWVPLDLTRLTGNSGTLALISEIQTLISQLAKQSDAPSLSKLRNLLAHLCFGTEERNGFVVDPFKQTVNGGSPYTDVGALAALRVKKVLTDCDVPLALLYWTASGVQFVDMGSVRRRPVTGPPSQYWPLAVAGRYQMIGEAVSLQFQEQLAQLLDPNAPQSQLATIRATDYFRYLPAGGMVPYSGPSGNFALTSAFSPQFFDGTVHRDLVDIDGTMHPVYIEGAKVEHLLRDSLSYRSFNLSEQVTFWVYRVRENIQAITVGTSNIPQAYLLFLSGHVPYQGNAQFNLAHWDYSNYATTTD